MKLRFPMFHEGRMISFLEILSHVDGRGLSWNVSHLWAQPRHDSRLDILKMEELAGMTPSPLWMTWLQLLRFGGEVEQVIDGDFAGHPAPGGTSRKPVVTVTAFDNTEWIVSAAEPRRCDLGDSPASGESDDAPWRVVREGALPGPGCRRRPDPPAPGRLRPGISTAVPGQDRLPTGDRESRPQPKTLPVTHEARAPKVSSGDPPSGGPRRSSRPCPERAR